MTPEIKNNARHQVACAIGRAIDKYNKENPDHPSNDEWVECVSEAAIQLGQYLAAPKRGPGRPRKVRPAPEAGDESAGISVK